MRKISIPGIYPDFPIEDYFADPCPEPSLSQSIAKMLINQSPAHAAWEHPRLTERARDEDVPTAEQTIGDAVHKLMLGRGKEVAEATFDTWRTGAARKFRIDTLKLGFVPILSKHLEKANAIALTANEHLRRLGWMNTIKRHTEVVAVAQEGPTWLRTLIDWIDADKRVVYDIKTLSGSAAPHEIPRTLIGHGWDIQAAFHERILDALNPDNAGRREYRYVAIEQDPPHGVCCCILPESVRTIGRKKVDAAIRVWVDCMKHQRWPAYLGVYFPELLGWAESQWLAREVDADEAEKKARSQFDPNVMMAG